jgi:ABC-type polysaccharide/polyol phosphate export permease
VIDYVGRIWTLRYFWLSLIRIDLQNRYRRSLLGVGWSLLQPLMMTAVLCTVFHGLFGVDVWQYAPYVFVGLSFWAFINHVISHGCQAFHIATTYIRQQRAPMAIYPLRTVSVGGLQLLIATAAVLPLAVWLSGTPFDWPLLSLPLTFALYLAIGWSLAVLSGVATVYFPDIEHLSPAALQIVFYATPVIYPAAALRDRGFDWAIDYNPLAACLELLRKPLLDAAWPSLTSLAVAAGFTLLLTTVAGLVLARAERRLVFRL